MHRISYYQYKVREKHERKGTILGKNSYIVALPFGVFEKVLSDNSNQVIADTIHSLKQRLKGEDFGILGQIRKTVLQLSAPPQLVQELKNEMKSARMPWPGDEGEQRWEQAWIAIKKVWASKWNERAYFSIRKIYAEVVKGLGETLVGAYPGRALSFVCKKMDLDSPKVLGYPSKPIGLFIKRSIIFRSDSNGEDLEGYAGAGLYDSVPMDKEEKVALDYSTDPLIVDSKFRDSILSNIAKAGHAIEELYGSPQDIEGVVKDCTCQEAEETIEELRSEAKMWERNAQKLMIDLELLMKELEFGDQSRRQADLDLELSTVCSERDGLKQEIEQLRTVIEEAQMASEISIFQTDGINYIKKELEEEIKFHKESNANLTINLKKSQ
ncbi:hypothetical protein GIB67_018378 [Kingdonia uniflora]|uniref:Uncharacterized protein n=1 Tax=Kingdonia uniflora TaxID=39325 RepID=A0A7J7MJA2_9MAGN|nr:hypothetical protein GIB67_018378 [Kingdonia uniflora]